MICFKCDKKIKTGKMVWDDPNYLLIPESEIWENACFCSKKCITEFVMNRLVKIKAR